MSNEDLRPTQFLSFDHDDRDRAVEGDRFDFLDPSIAVLDNMESSQIMPTANEDRLLDGTELETTFLSTGSFTTTSLTDSSFQTSDVPVLKSPIQQEADLSNIKLAGPITDLKRIPNASHITRIQPQTITVNLLVGIISISAARTVRLRRRNAEMDIIELTVGDETRAGFSITFWLVPVESQRKPVDDLREKLQRLRIGDVVLLQDVALSCFRDCVYGQSLSKRLARNSTSINVLREDDNEVQSTSVASKFLRVREWTSNCVGGSRATALIARAGNDLARATNLPPDTQD